MKFFFLLFSTTMLFIAQALSQTVLPSPAGEGAMALRLTQSKMGLIMSWLEPFKNEKPTTGGKAYELKWSIYQNNIWSPAKTVTSSNKMFANTADTPSVQCLNEKICFAHWLEKTNEQTFAYDAVIASSEDAGTTWKQLGTIRATRPNQIENYDGFLSFVTEGNAIRTFWIDGSKDDGKEHAMQLSTAELTTQGLQNKTIIDDSICSCCNTSAALSSEGPVVVYRGRRNNEIRDIHISRLTKTTWSKPLAVNHDAWQISGCPVNGPQVSTSGKTLAVSWFTAPLGTGLVRLAWSKNNGRTFSKPININEPEGAIGRATLALLPSKEALVLWIGRTQNPQKFELLLRRVGDDGRVGNVYKVTESDASWKSGFPQMAILKDQLLIGWQLNRPEGNQNKYIPGIQLMNVALEKIPPVSHKPKIENKTLDHNIDLSMTGFTDLERQPIMLSDLKAKIILINMWATWCEPCRKEQQELSKIYEKYKNKGLEIVAINQDMHPEKSIIEKFIKENKLGYHVWLDPKATAKSMLSINAIPATYLVSLDGKILLKKIGFQKDLKNQIEKKLINVLQ